MTKRALLALLVATAVLLAACGGASQTEKSGTDGGDRVLFEPASSHGPDPFTETVATVTPTVGEVEALGGTTGPGVIQVGNTPGLYGGSGDQAVCDAAKLISFLEENAEKAAAWAGAAGIETSEIGAYVEGLSPVLLLHDTQVTNHGYKDGKATPRQSVLEAGTAVLVDTFGVPRVRCACGNPLAEPVPGDDGVDVGDPIYIVPGPHQPTPPDPGASEPDSEPDDFCTIYAAMKADVGGGPSGPGEIEAYVARLADWLNQLVDAAQSIPGFPTDGLADLIAYRDDAAAGPSGLGDTALRDRVESFLESYCANPPPTPEPAPSPPEGPVPDTNCGSFQFFLLVETAEALGLDWEPVGGTYFDQLTEFEADSYADILEYEEIGCEGVQVMIEFLEANGIPNPFA